MLTIVIPTMNRSDFLIRLLNYYEKTHYKHWILIGDSSNAEHLEITKKTLRRFKGKLKIIYRELPNLNDVECMRRLIEEVTTPYAVFVADDDILIPNGLEQCIQFLESNHDYIAAHGLGICLKLRSVGPYGEILGCTNYTLPSVEADTAAQRLSNHLKEYAVTLFCVHRIKEWREMYRTDEVIKDKSFGSELMPCCLSVVQGKVKQLNCFYLVRQDHNRRYLLPNIKDWVRSKNWEPSYKIFRDRLAKEIAQRDAITLDEATKIVEAAFKSYLDTFNTRYARIQIAFSYIPGLRYVVGLARYFRSNNSEFSLPMLLNSTSLYHNDFMPVYQIVTESLKK